MNKFVYITLSVMIILSITACSSETKISDTSSIVTESNIFDSTEESYAESDTIQLTHSDIIFDIIEDTNTDINTDTDTDTNTAASTDTNTDTYTEINSNTEYDNYYYNNSDGVKTNISTCKIFRKVICCGDSYTAGYIVDPEGKAHTVNEDYSWPHYMSTFTGNEWYNCGCTGCTVTTWQQHERGLPTARKLGKAQAYVIGLMINDATSNNKVELGNINDIGTNNQTYYGGMSKIIRELNAISPKAKIFVNTCPKPDDIYIGYNQAVRDIVNAYKNKYPVHCIDLAENAYMYENESLKNDYLLSHYTAIGYEQFAEIYAVILSDYINNHIEEFQDVAFIEYDK